MQLATLASPDPLRTDTFTRRLADARDQLAYVRGAAIDTTQRADFARGHLHTASAAIHQALAGSNLLPSDLPSGVTSFPREAAALLQAAIGEVGRIDQGSPIDTALVHRTVDSAIGRLQRAILLVAHPPSDVVFDGS